MPRDEMRAVKLDERLLFIPVDRGQRRSTTGARAGPARPPNPMSSAASSSRPSEKMGAFRVDQGPRIWRTVGQRQHKLARRV